MRKYYFPIVGLLWVLVLYLSPQILQSYRAIFPESKTARSPENSVQNSDLSVKDSQAKKQSKTPVLSPSKSPTAKSEKKAVSVPPDHSETKPPKSDVPMEPDRLEIELGQRQVTLYVGDVALKSYPVAIGREGWNTPRGNFRIMDMQLNPEWINPLTNQAIPSGAPDNPLGNYWIGFWTDGHNWIGFHGTPNPETVGQAVSHGCIRMYNEDIAELYAQVRTGIPVIVKP